MITAANKWNANDYADNSSAQEIWAKELIEKLALQGKEHLLDIGCGDGKITHTLSRELTGGRVVGIDQSPNMIELASKKFNENNLSFLVMDATRVSLSEKFDIVFSNAALHWIKDHKKILIHIKKHLNPNAKILFQMGGYGNAAGIMEIVTQAAESPKWADYFETFINPYHFYKIRDYEDWLFQTGYKAKRVQLIAKDMVHENSDKLKGWLRTTWFPYTDQLPDNEKETFLTHVVEQYIQNNPIDSAGKTHVKMIRLEVEAISV
jgi:trans-aconitate methyltransferase